MPIHRTINLRPVSDEEFAIIDDVVMSCAYATQNKFGRLFDERVYENDLATRLRAEGFEVLTQVPVSLSHGTFTKTYYLDLIVNGMIYELKVAATILPEHEAQALHYAMLHDSRLVKVLNFGGIKVCGKLRRNALTGVDRYQPKLRSSKWESLSPACDQLLTSTKALIKDFGTHLASRLYNDALVHQFGGETACLKRIDILSNQNQMGTHLVQFYHPGLIFFLTSLSHDHASIRSHLETLLVHSDLKGIQWINLNRSHVEVITLQKTGNRMGATE
jgi:GxxExxY protein